MNWNLDESERYSRHFMLKEIGEDGQLKLKNSSILVIGAGGLGCPVLLYLASAGVGTIGIADYDNVELSNLHRQFLFTVADIGKLKAEIAAIAITRLNPNVKTVFYPEKISNSNALDIFADYDLIIDCSDNFQTRYIINDAAVLLNKTFIYSAVQKFEGQVAVFNQPLHSGKRSATYRCLHPEAPLPGSVVSCNEVGVLGIVPGIFGSFQANEAIKIITETVNSLVGKVLFCNTLTMQFNTFTISRNENLWQNFPVSKADFLEMDYDSFCSAKTIHESVKNISAKELKNLLNENKIFQFVDVRNYNEKPELDFDPIVKIPLIELVERSNEINLEIPVIVVCASGERSMKAAELLTSHFNGINILNLTGGVKAWLIETQVK